MAVPDSSQSEVDARLVRAAILRMNPDPEIGGSWDDIADACGLSRKWLYKLRNRPEKWGPAVEMAIGGLRHEMLTTGVARLLASAKGEPGGPGVGAANSLLDRAGMPTTHRVELDDHRHQDDLSLQELAEVALDGETGLDLESSGEESAEFD